MTIRIVRLQLLLGIIVASVVGLSSTDRPSSAAAPALHEMRFLDEDTGDSISAQLDQSASDFGHWTVVVTGRAYAGDAGTALKVNSATSAVLTYDGTAVLRRPAGMAQTVQVKLNAQLDASHRTAEATLWDGSDRFHFVAKAPTIAGLDKVTAALESAIVANDPIALYPVLNRQIVGKYDQSGFATLWFQQSSAAGKVTALRKISVGTPQATDQGSWVVTVEYSADLMTPAGASTGSFSALFIHEVGGWKLWSTERH